MRRSLSRLIRSFLALRSKKPAVKVLSHHGQKKFIAQRTQRLRAKASTLPD
jgi:hypothetical protein